MFDDFKEPLSVELYRPIWERHKEFGEQWHSAEPAKTLLLYGEVKSMLADDWIQGDKGRKFVQEYGLTKGDETTVNLALYHAARGYLEYRLREYRKGTTSVQTKEDTINDFRALEKHFEREPDQQRLGKFYSEIVATVDGYIATALEQAIDDGKKAKKPGGIFRRRR